MSWNNKKWIKRLLLLLLCVVSIVVTVSFLYKIQQSTIIKPYKTLSYSDCYRYCKNGMVRNITVYENYMLVTVVFNNKNQSIEVFKVFIPNNDFSFVQEIKTYTNVTFEEKKGQFLMGIGRVIMNLLPFLFIVWYVRRNMNPDGSQDEKDEENIKSSSISTLDDCVGFGSIKKDMIALVNMWVYDSKYSAKKQDFIKTILFRGPPGTGKTFMAKVLAKTVDASFLMIDISKIGSAFIHQTSRNVQKVFDKARELASQEKMVMIFVDEADSILQKRDYGVGNIGDKENTEVVTTILRNVSGIGSKFDHNIMLICATNHDNLDEAFKSRVAQTYVFGLIPFWDRYDFIKLLINTQFNEVNWSIDVSLMAKLTYGSSQRDIQNILMNASAMAKARFLGDNKISSVTNDEVFTALITGERTQQLLITKDSRLSIAMHEAGHFVVAYVLNLHDLYALSAIAIGMTVEHGFAITFLGVEDYSIVLEDDVRIRMYQEKKNIVADVLVSMGGKVGELLFDSIRKKQSVNHAELSTLFGWSSDLNSILYNMENMYSGGVDLRDYISMIYLIIQKLHLFEEKVTLNIMGQKEKIEFNGQISQEDLYNILKNINEKSIDNIYINEEKLETFMYLNFGFIINALIDRKKTFKDKKKQVFLQQVCQISWIICHLILNKYKNFVVDIANAANANLLVHGDPLQNIASKHLIK